MASTPKAAANIFQFRARDPLDDIPETPLPLPAKAAPVVAPAARAAALDLAGKRKVWFVAGRGGSGKTMLLRWAGEIAHERGAEVIYAACDPLNRSWKLFLDGVVEPPTNDPQETASWMQNLLQHLMRPDASTSAMIDLGGGDTALALLVKAMPDLAEVMEAAGVTPVLVHVIGANPDDLVPMAELDNVGFQPAATVIVCNERLDRRDRFGPVLRHSVLRGALDRGAQQVWMPYLTKDTARLVDARHLPFLQVGNSLGPFHGAAVRGWLKAMGEEFAPVMTWWP